MSQKLAEMRDKYNTSKEGSEQQLPNYGTTSINIASHTFLPISTKWHYYTLDKQSLVSQTMGEIEDSTNF
eukprot:12798338-Ditylum_brightwellii.AAC.1